MYRMYGRNVSSCRNVNLYEKGYGSQIQKELIEFHSGYAWIPGLFFPYTLFLIWVWLFEICKKRYGGGTGLCSKLVLIRLLPPTGCLRVAFLGTLLESATEGRSKCSQSPSCWPGKGLENMIFFPLFFEHAREVQQNSRGRMPVEGELCQSHVLARRWGRAGRPVQPKACVRPARGSAVPPGPGGSPPPWEQRKWSIPLGEERPRSAVCAGIAPAPPAAGRESNAAEAPPAEITVSRNSDFPQRRVVRAWVV